MDIYARRLQVQERLTQEIATLLQDTAPFAGNSSIWSTADCSQLISKQQDGCG